MDPLLEQVLDKGNRVVFLDLALTAGGGVSSLIGRIKIELFYDNCPKTCENFRKLCTGEYHNPADTFDTINIAQSLAGISSSSSTSHNLKPVGYKGSTFHFIEKNKIIHGGDIDKNDGTGRSYSIYGTQFPVENYNLQHDTAGLISMKQNEHGQFGSQFSITLSPSNNSELNNRNIVFGKVLDLASMEILRKIEQVPVNHEGKPLMKMMIENCGEL